MFNKSITLETENITFQRSILLCFKKINNEKNYIEAQIYYFFQKK